MDYSPEEVKQADDPQSSTEQLVQMISRYKKGIPGIVFVGILLVLVTLYYAWIVGIPAIATWANASSTRWTYAWLGIAFAVISPFLVWGVIEPLVTAAINLSTKQGDRKIFSDVELVENEIKLSADPVDFARYSRKALHAYHTMGQSQVKRSFNIGVIAMVLGFLFLIVGLLAQAVDTAYVPFLRKDLDVSAIAIGGGLIIEFIAATFIWVYRTAIVQQNVYYRKQMQIHSALLTVSVAKQMTTGADAALREIVCSLIAPDVEFVIPHVPKTRGSGAGKMKEDVAEAA